MVSVKVKPGKTPEEKERNLNIALSIFKDKVKQSGVLKEYVSRKYYTKPKTIRKLKKQRKLFMSRKYSDYWKED